MPGVEGRPWSKTVISTRRILRVWSRTEFTQFSIREKELRSLRRQAVKEKKEKKKRRRFRKALGTGIAAI